MEGVKGGGRGPGGRHKAEDAYRTANGAEMGQGRRGRVVIEAGWSLRGWGIGAGWKQWRRDEYKHHLPCQFSLQIQRLELSSVCDRDNRTVAMAEPFLHNDKH